jgi:hypothetical protein
MNSATLREAIALADRLSGEDQRGLAASEEYRALFGDMPWDETYDRYGVD